MGDLHTFYARPNLKGNSVTKQAKEVQHNAEGLGMAQTTAVRETAHTAPSEYMGEEVKTSLPTALTHTNAQATHPARRTITDWSDTQHSDRSHSSKRGHKKEGYTSSASEARSYASSRARSHRSYSHISNVKVIQGRMRSSRRSKWGTPPSPPRGRSSPEHSSCSVSRASFSSANYG